MVVRPGGGSLRQKLFRPIWFFDATNIELVVKVLDACGVNGRHWVFSGGLTNVEVTLAVIDTVTGAVRTYSNPPGTPFAPIEDAWVLVCP